MSSPAAVRRFIETETARLGARIRRIHAEVAAGHLTPSETYTALALAFEDHADGIAVVRRAFTASASRFLAEPVGSAPDYAARCRRVLATLLAVDGPEPLREADRIAAAAMDTIDAAVARGELPG
jgi:hypothetical protein